MFGFSLSVKSYLGVCTRAHASDLSFFTAQEDELREFQNIPYALKSFIFYFEKYKFATCFIPQDINEHNFIAAFCLLHVQ